MKNIRFFISVIMAALITCSALGAESSTEAGVSPSAEVQASGQAESSTAAYGETEAVDPHEPFIAYVSGVDTRAEELEQSNGDVNILMVVNPQTRNILLLNTPRDYYIENPAGGNAMDKLTHCAVYGIENSEKALGQLYGCDVNYYMQVNFEGFKKIIDAIGGVSVYSSETFSAGGYDFVEGYNDMDGDKALVFARDRYDVAYGDNGRGRNQMRVIEAVIQKIFDDPSCLDQNMDELLEGLGGTLETDIPVLTVFTMITDHVSDSESAQPLNVHEYAVTGHNGIDKTWSMEEPTNVMYQDPDLVAHASDLIQKVLDGENLTDDMVGEIVQEW